MFDVVSVIPGLAWPAVPSPVACRLLALQFQLEQSQWLTNDQLRQHQFEQLGGVLAFAYRTVPFYREVFDRAGIAVDEMVDIELWTRVPLLTRTAIQFAGELLHSGAVPTGHTPLAKMFTSGSTGSPVVTTATLPTGFMWVALSLRDQLWHRRDFRGKCAFIRVPKGNPTERGQSQHSTSWDANIGEVVRTGPAAMLDISVETNRQAEWLQRENPDYLMTYPTNVAALARQFVSHGLKLPRLRQVATFGEALDPSVRRLCREAWGVAVVDCYSCEELGFIALQCPEHEHYHVQSESVLVEVLRADGSACGPGEVGRVVVTSLLNFAMPLIRYDLGDYAEVGEPCPCGRGLPVLRRILGRQRNMAVLPDGRTFWPSLELSAADVEALPPIQQFQLVQRSLREMELSLVTPRPLTEAEEALVRAWAGKATNDAYSLSVRYVDSIARSPSGKYEDFRCDVVAPAQSASGSNAST